MSSPAALPEVSVELGGEAYSLVASFYAMQELSKALGSSNIDQMLSEQPFSAIPHMLAAMTAHSDKRIDADQAARLIGPANVKYYSDKINQATSMAAPKNPTEAKAAASPTGGSLKPSRKSS